MNFFFQILCGRGLRGPSSACWFTRLSYARPDMLFMLLRRSACRQAEKHAEQQELEGLGWQQLHPKQG
jgi:hypothetical protein